MHRKQFIILILLLVVGFASVSTTLILNGNIGIGVELDDFDVIFVEALLDGKEDSKATISEDKKTITFTTDKFINPGDSTRLDYKVKNTSTQYDADVTINCTNEANEYVTVESSFDGNSIPLISQIKIKAQEVKSGYINAKLIKSYPGDDTSIEISCKIEFTATSREEYAYSLNFDSNGGSKIYDKSIVLNDTYGELETPEREGYTFLGWYDDEDVKVDESTIFDTKGNRNLYAKWEETVYDLNIVTVKDGVSKTNTIGITYGQKLEISINEKNYYISKMECSDGYSIEDYKLVIPTYGEQKPNIKNNKIEKAGTCTFTLEQGIFEFGYTGAEQTFTVPLNGDYKVELWGAQGGETFNYKINSLGGYTSGNILMGKGNKIYIYIGEKGNTLRKEIFNGGGLGGFSAPYYSMPSNVIGKDWGYYGNSGGGSSDVRLVNGLWNDFDSLKSRIIVAAGGGGSGGYNFSGQNSSAGGILGYKGNYYAGHGDTGSYGSGASQISGGKGGNNYVSYGVNNPGLFGQGGTSNSYSSAASIDGTVRFSSGAGSGGGGGGYYGGGSGGGTGAGGDGHGGGGGSSFISGHNGCDAIAESSTSSKIIHTGQPNHYSGYVFTDTVMIDGLGYKWTNVKGSYIGMPTHDGTGTMTGNSENGYAKITLLSID